MLEKSEPAGVALGRQMGLASSLRTGIILLLSPVLQRCSSPAYLLRSTYLQAGAASGVPSHAGMGRNSIFGRRLRPS